MKYPFGMERTANVLRKNLIGGEYVDIFHSFLLWIQGEKKVIQHSNFWAASANNLKRSAKFSNGL